MITLLWCKEIAYYAVHSHKNEAGIEADTILKTLFKDDTVMHDHNKINYKYSYQQYSLNS